MTLEKHLSVGTSQSGGLFRAYGEGDSQAAAEAQALAALNGQRDHRCGKAAAGGSLDRAGNAYTVDIT